MNDLECPYCGHEQEVCHDDGFGYEEDVCHETECYECEKTFTFNTIISFSYTSNRADCLNGGEHELKPTITYPKKYTKMRCETCDYERSCTDEELVLHVGSL